MEGYVQGALRKELLTGRFLKQFAKKSDYFGKVSMIKFINTLNKNY